MSPKGDGSNNSSNSNAAGGSNNSGSGGSSSINDGSGFYLDWPDEKTTEIRVPLSLDASKGMKKSKPLTFTLDRIFPPQTTQEEMFEAVCTYVRTHAHARTRRQARLHTQAGTLVHACMHACACARVGYTHARTLTRVCVLCPSCRRLARVVHRPALPYPVCHRSAACLPFFFFFFFMFLNIGAHSCQPCSP